MVLFKHNPDAGLVLEMNVNGMIAVVLALVLNCIATMWLCLSTTSRRSPSNQPAPAVLPAEVEFVETVVTQPLQFIWISKTARDKDHVSDQCHHDSRAARYVQT